MRIEAQYVRAGDRVINQPEWSSREVTIASRDWADEWMYICYKIGTGIWYRSSDRLDVDGMTKQELTMRMLAS